jgi:chromosome segregation ATPase
MDKVKRLDEQLKSKQNELKNERGKLSYKSTEDIDKQISRLQSQVDSGQMKIVDEKKALGEISQLNRQKKAFGGFDSKEKEITALKDQISQLKTQLNDPEQKALSDRYNTIQTELDKLKAEADEAFKSIKSLRDDRTKAHNTQQQKWEALRKLKDDYYASRRAFKEYEDAVYKARREKQRSEREAAESAKRKAIAKEKLEEASSPAYAGDIQTAEGLIRFFDPSSVPAQTASGPGKFAATASRTVDDAGLKGTRLTRKGEEEENYFIGTGGKKGKKGKKNADSNGPSEGKFNLDLGVIEQLSRINVDAPSNKSEVPEVVAKLKEKVEFWKKDQDRKTKEVRFLF